MSGPIGILELPPAPAEGDNLVDEVQGLLENAGIAEWWRDIILSNVRMAQAQSKTWAELDARAIAQLAEIGQ